MIMDERLVYSDGQEVSASAASTNYVDHLAGGDAANELFLNVNISQASDSADDGETVTGKLQTADSSDFSDAEDLTPEIDLAQKAAGTTVFNGRVPRGLKRYTRMYYTVGGTALSQNPKVSAQLTTAPQTNR